MFSYENHCVVHLLIATAVEMFFKWFSLKRADNRVCTTDTFPLHTHRAMKHKTQGLKISFDFEIGSPSDSGLKEEFVHLAKEVSLALFFFLFAHTHSMACGDICCLQFWNKSGSEAGTQEVARQVFFNN